MYIVAKLVCASRVPHRETPELISTWLDEIPVAAEVYGFRLSRVRGGHHIYVHPDVPELVNLQKVKGKAKPYQVKQLLQLIERYNLSVEDAS